ncbi:Cys-tRNA(Pro) deacylase [Geopsychrobacter electrodiphilus]|uniref:Cys-tRNA(Pro) deacylase n=1 Tax=Geopsychrobacter electrodiphilus TaxID=225196 RepID=UPI0003659DAC|nr:Cys-tRNA(Pro) deacylase [Geopsychrobacter electrodiphilus]
MAKEKYPMTQAIRQLRQQQIEFVPRPYKYEERGGTETSARELGVDEHLVIKTLVMEDEQKQALIVLMHGDREVSLKNLARQIDVKQINPCAPKTADALTGYQTGGISPFGTRKPLPVYIEKSILALEKIYINGGKRGFLIEIKPTDLLRGLKPTEVEVGIQG